MTLEVAICICTRNRPRELAAALESLRASTQPIAQVVIADDSTEPGTAEVVARCCPEALHVPGPRRGLGANRNRALEHVTAERVLFIDDDVVLGPSFLETIGRCLEQLPDAERAIVTGRERQGERLIAAHGQDFLGFQRRPYAVGESLETVVINAAVFPARLFDYVRFDPQLVYGLDEVDLTTRAVAAGYRIVACPEAVNEHRPSPVNRDYYRRHLDASRLYVTWKRYARTERRLVKATLYAIVAPLHVVAASLRRGGVGGAWQGLRAIHEAIGYARSEIGGGR